MNEKGKQTIKRLGQSHFFCRAYTTFGIQLMKFQSFRLVYTLHANMRFHIMISVWIQFELTKQIIIKNEMALNWRGEEMKCAATSEWKSAYKYIYKWVRAIRVNEIVINTRLTYLAKFRKRCLFDHLQVENYLVCATAWQILFVYPPLPSYSADTQPIFSQQPLKIHLWCHSSELLTLHGVQLSSNHIANATNDIDGKH